MDHHTLSGSTLAYIGDAVWSLLVREYLVEIGFTKAKDLQEKSIDYVSAKSQAEIFHCLEQENYFNEEELTIFKRGRNNKNDNVPKNTDVAVYRISTGFEALIGYWHLNHQQERLTQTWDKVKHLRKRNYGTI